MKVKILRVISRLNIGGPAIHTVLLTEAFSDDIFDSVLVSGSIDFCEGDMSYLLNQHKLRHICIPELGRDLNLGSDLRALWKLYLLIKKEKPDILHTHTAKAGTLGRIAAMLAGVKVKIHTFHGHIFYGYFGVFKTRIFSLVERFLSFFTSKIVAISQSQAREIKSILKIPERKLVVVPLGLDLDKYLEIPSTKGIQLNKELSLPPDILLVGIVGRLTQIKNHDFFIKVAARINDDFNGKFNFIIIGDGELRGCLQRQVCDLRLTNSVKFLGWRKDLDRVYSGLDIVVLTSLNEGTPVSLIEAMASARPVIATDVGGVGDLVIDGKTGFLCPVNDLDCFYNRLKILMNDQNMRYSFGNNGRLSVKDRFSKERLFNDIRRLYIGELKVKAG